MLKNLLDALKKGKPQKSGCCDVKIVPKDSNSQKESEKDKPDKDNNKCC